jgi:hypothetical protein
MHRLRYIYIIIIGLGLDWIMPDASHFVYHYRQAGEGEPSSRPRGVHKAVADATVRE